MACEACSGAVQRVLSKMEGARARGALRAGRFAFRGSSERRRARASVRRSFARSSPAPAVAAVSALPLRPPVHRRRRADRRPRRTPPQHNATMAHAGVEAIDISLAEQRVTVRCSANVTPEAVLEKVAKTGKKAAFWG